MARRVTRSRFQARALEYFRQIQASGKPMIVTDHGEPRFEIRPFRSQDADLPGALPGQVLAFGELPSPWIDDDWEAAQ